MIGPIIPGTTPSTVTSSSPLQQLAQWFQRSGITPSGQANSSADPAAMLPQNQIPQTPNAQGAAQTNGQLTPVQGAVQGALSNYLGGGVTAAGVPQTSTLAGLGNWLGNTPIQGPTMPSQGMNGDPMAQVTQQPSFMNSIYRMMP